MDIPNLEDHTEFECTSPQKITRRDFIKMIGAAVLFNEASLNMPNPQTESDENLKVQEKLDFFNGFIDKHMFLDGTYSSISGVNEIDDLETLDSIVNTYGGYARVFSGTGYHLIPQFMVDQSNLWYPITRVYCDPSISPSPFNFIQRINDTVDGKYYPVDNGYVRIPDSFFNGITVDNLEIGDEIFKYLQSVNAVSFLTPEGIYRSFEEIIFLLYGTNPYELNIFTTELLPYFTKYQYTNTRLITTDGKLGNFGMEIHNRDKTVNVHGAEVSINGRYLHTVLTNGALQRLSGKCASLMLDSEEIFDYIKNIIENSGNEVNIVIDPHSIGYEGRLRKYIDALNGKDIDSLKTLLCLSTENANGVITLTDKLQPGMICFTTINKNSNGEYFMPQNRSYVSEEYSNDRMFGMPDDVETLNIFWSMYVNSNGLNVAPEAYKVNASGASFSTCQGALLVRAVVEKLTIDGDYSEEKLINAMRFICPIKNVSGKNIRVPDLEMIDQYFSGRSDVYLPYLYKSSY